MDAVHVSFKNFKRGQKKDILGLSPGLRYKGVANKVFIMAEENRMVSTYKQTNRP